MRWLGAFADGIVCVRLAVCFCRWDDLGEAGTKLSAVNCQ